MHLNGFLILPKPRLLSTTENYSAECRERQRKQDRTAACENHLEKSHHAMKKAKEDAANSPTTDPTSDDNYGDANPIDNKPNLELKDNEVTTTHIKNSCVALPSDTIGLNTLTLRTTAKLHCFLAPTLKKTLCLQILVHP
jgi:hypothetical protein